MRKLLEKYIGCVVIFGLTATQQRTTWKIIQSLEKRS